MKLSDKPVEVRPLTVAGTIAAFRSMGRAKDADELEAQVRFFEESTNWTFEEIAALDMAEYPKFAEQFAEAFARLAAAAIPPPIATSSASGPAEPVAQSPVG